MRLSSLLLISISIFPFLGRRSPTGTCPTSGMPQKCGTRRALAAKLFKEGTPSPATGGTLCYGRGGNEKRASRLPPHPLPRPPEEACRRSLWGQRSALPPALTTSVNPGASVGQLTLTRRSVDTRPRAHAPDLFRVYSPSLCLERLTHKAVRVVGPRLLIPSRLFAANQHICWPSGYPPPRQRALQWLPATRQ